MGKGYKFYQEVKPNGRLFEERWIKIDHKICETFALYERSKNSRYYNKKQGRANYLYIRYSNLAIILKTNGANLNIETGDFHDIYENPLILRISDKLYLKIGQGRATKGLTCYIEKNCYREIKSEMFLMIEHRQLRELEYRFNALNGIPSYSGINEQKKQLKKLLLLHAKKHNVVINKKHLFVGVKRKIFTVFT